MSFEPSSANLCGPLRLSAVKYFLWPQGLLFASVHLLSKEQKAAR
jgi:hypothetical protein